MTDEILKAFMSYLTLLTIVGSIFVPSVFIAAALGMTVAMIGAVALNSGPPDSQIVAAWVVAQVGAAVIINLVRRRIR